MKVDDAEAVKASEKLIRGLTDAARPGLAVRILRGADIVYDGAIGLANIEHSVPVTSRTAFRIGSSTKHMACAVALLLAREGRIDIEAPVNAYLPELPDYPVKPTVRQLMNNTSGVCDFLELLTASGAGLLRPVSWPTSCDLVVRQRHLNSVPGAEFIYSAGGFLVLCMIAERVTGRPTEELFDEMLFGPLGMKESTLLVNDRTIVAHMASPYLEPAPGRFVKGGWGLEAKGEGGVVSTVGDMAIWARELLSPRVLGADVVAAMTEPLTYSSGVRGKYGLGLYTRSFDGWKVFGHGGRTPGMRAEIAMYPEADLSVIVLTNHHNVDPYTVGRSLAALWLGDRRTPETAGPAEAVAGSFVGAAGDDHVEIRVRDGQPWLATTSGWAEMRWEEGGWVPVNSVLDMKFRPTAAGVENLSSGTPVAYGRVEAPAGYDPADYVGSYRNDDLATTYTVARTGDRLSLRMQGELGCNDTHLECVAPDLFRAPPADPRASWNQPYLYFVRDARGAVDAALYSTDRTKRLRFGRL